MIEPSLAVQTAIRAHLIPNQALSAHVPAQHIRAGSTRPDKLPSVIIADGQTEFLGRAAGGQYVARVYLDLHFWAVEDGLDTVKTIGGIVAEALRDAPNGDEIAFDEWQLTRLVWPRDPDPKYGHGVLSVEAAIRWAV
ncbi:MAG: DUF3168 domain-containing protein [Methylobacterium mesophilicum]|nr:DUF3168 domain-containing protein [Methylobacterium mesophilicum]